MIYYIVDAFAEKMFAGNQAGVCVLICDDLKATDRVEMAGKCVCYLKGELQL